MFNTSLEMTVIDVLHKDFSHASGVFRANWKWKRLLFCQLGDKQRRQPSISPQYIIPSNKKFGSLQADSCL